MDVRSGGARRFVCQGPDGVEYAFRGEFQEIVTPERIVQTFEFEGMPGHISVETLTLEERDGMLNSGMQEGASETDDRLEELQEG